LQNILNSLETGLCPLFVRLLGRCTRGASCKFAHSAGESMAKNMMQPTGFGNLRMGKIVEAVEQ
jgi:hypothetical protein